MNRSLFRLISCLSAVGHCLSPRRALPALLLASLFAPAARAQQMPQDNWRYDGLQFSSPTPANYLRSIAIGSGGVYVGEGGTSSGSAATKVIQFTEGGVFVRRRMPSS